MQAKSTISLLFSSGLLIGWMPDRTQYLPPVPVDRVARNSALTFDRHLAQPVSYEFENISNPTMLITGQKKTRDNYPELGLLTQSKRKRIPFAGIRKCGSSSAYWGIGQIHSRGLEFLKNTKCDKPGAYKFTEEKLDFLYP